VEDTFTSADPEPWMGENTRRGLFAPIGPAFKTGTVEGLSILDLAPTLLHLHGHAIPQDMDGNVRADLFADDHEAGSRAVQRMETDRFRRLKERNRIRLAAMAIERSV